MRVFRSECIVGKSLARLKSGMKRLSKFIQASVNVSFDRWFDLVDDKIVVFHISLYFDVDSAAGFADVVAIIS